MEGPASGSRVFVAGLIAIKRVGCQSKEIFHRERDTRGNMVFEFGERNHHVGVGIRVVQIEGGKHVATRWDPQMGVAAAVAEIASVLKLYLAKCLEGFDIPICQ